VDGGSDKGTNNKPGARVRQQSLDVVALLSHVLGEVGRREGTELGAAAIPELYMFMEDDFRLCPHALLFLQYAVEKAFRQDAEWQMLRVSYGLNGALMRGRDLAAFRAYLDEHHTRRPPDHLMVEWYAQETTQAREALKGRPHFTARYNLLEHLGHVSSLRTSKQVQHLAGCYDLMDDSVLFPVEAFDVEACANEDISPCVLDTPGPRAESAGGDAAARDPAAQPPVPFAFLASLIRRVSKGVWRGQHPAATMRIYNEPCSKIH
jgi:hypothetical protein